SSRNLPAGAPGPGGLIVVVDAVPSHQCDADEMTPRAYGEGGNAHWSYCAGSAPVCLVMRET
ncbi:hypothetical protein, partial [uncultured Chloroflexus sp.]|uniref:hypothetical protein n=1 Tax=uncultured Chloroflexus sp. TaxID=214040 RepID=UPI0026185300